MIEMRGGLSPVIRICTGFEQFWALAASRHVVTIAADLRFGICQRVGRGVSLNVLLVGSSVAYIFVFACWSKLLMLVLWVRVLFSVLVFGGPLGGFGGAFGITLGAFGRGRGQFLRKAAESRKTTEIFWFSLAQEQSGAAWMEPC